MTTVTIIGKGNMANAIGGVVASGGNTVEYAGREGGTVNGEIIVLAVPYPEVDAVITTYGDALAGKTIVDITNPLDFATFDGLVVPADSSAAAVIASKVPSAKVLKAFNTTLAATLSSKTVGGLLPTTVLVAGDDDTAKETLMEVIKAGGLRAIDAGSLKRARELEAIGFLQISLAAAERISWTGGFAVAP